jgi:hypothetical protein
MAALKALHADTIVTTIAIADIVITILGVCQRTSVLEIAIPAAMRSGALTTRPLHLQLPAQAHRLRRLPQGTLLAMTEAEQIQWKPVDTIATIIAIAAAATQRPAA